MGIFKNIFLVCVYCLSCLCIDITNAQSSDNESFKFAVMGCAHLGACDSKGYEAAVEKVNSYNPDFVLFLGGMVDVLSAKPIESVWQEFKRINEKLKSPSYNVPGNCTLMNFSVPDAKKAFSEEYFLKMYKQKTFVFEYKKNIFIGLDSDNLIDMKKGTKNNDQLNFLRQILNNAAKYDNIFVMMHDSLWASSEISDKWFKTVNPLFYKKVKYVFSSGNHKLNLTENNSINYISVNSASCFYSSPSNSGFPCFLMVEVAQKKVSVKVVPLIDGIPIGNLSGMQSARIKTNRSLLLESTLSYALSSAERENILQPRIVVDALNIKPGMNILDIGAGTGMFTFKFAEALRGTGNVYATEVDPKMVDNINLKAKELRYKNVTGVLVQPQGVDDFYLQHKFDIIFLCEVYHYLWDPAEYFKKFKGQLEPDTGRVFIIQFKDIFEFSQMEFGSFNSVVDVLNTEKDTFPVLKRLREETRDFVKNWNGGEISAVMKTKITEDFNIMLTEQGLFPELLEYYNLKQKKNSGVEWGVSLIRILNSSDIQLAKWLIVRLDEDGVFTANKHNITKKQEQELFMLNRILLCGIFQNSKLNKLKGYSQIYVNKKRIISVMEESGFQFVREHDFLTPYYFLEFKRKL